MHYRHKEQINHTNTQLSITYTDNNMRSFFPMAIMLFIISLICREVPFVLGGYWNRNFLWSPLIYLHCVTEIGRTSSHRGIFFVAVSEGLWDNGAACGRRYRLRCLSGNNKPCKVGSIDIKVVDFCRQSPCPSTMLLSNDAFKAVSRSPTARINVEYVQI